MSLVKVLNTLEECKDIVKREAARFHSPKVLNSCFIVVDKDGDFVDACSGRLPYNTLDAVIKRVMETHPENAPFRLIKWNGFEFVEVTAVS